MGTRIAKRDLEAMRQIEAMTDEELDAEIRSYGLDPDKLAKHAFNRVCEALRQKSIECASANTKVAALEQRIGVLERALKSAADDFAVMHDSCRLELIDTGMQLIAGRACDEARAALAETEKGEQRG